MLKINKPVVLLGASSLLAGALFLNLSATPEPQAVKEKEANLFGFVRSLEGTKPDGDLKVQPGDKLVVDAELGRMFDYYLSAFGEKSIDAIRLEAERELDRKLSPAAAAQAKRLLGRYLDYKRALVDVEKSQIADASPAKMARARLLAMQKVRAQYFSAEEAKGLFGFNDSYDMDALARMDVAEDKSLNEAQKSAKLAALDAAMPPALREEREAPLRIAKAEDTVKKMREQGATEQAIYQFRAATFSPEAAARLAEVDKEENEWKSRIASYLNERKNLLAAQANQPEDVRQAALQQLRQARFNEQEQGRLVAYEQ